MDWTTLRDQFPVTQHWAFFDHAAIAPLTAPAVVALAEYATDLARHGVAHEPRWTRRVAEVRALFGRLLHCDAHDVAFVKNTSEGIGFVAEGFPWRDGDNVITAAEEYPSNIYPWLNLAARGVEVRTVATRQGRIHLDDLSLLIDQRTRLVSLSFVEYGSGFRNNLDAVGALCRERGIYFCVDAIQGLGVLPLDVSRSPVDFLAADGHKWLLGPEGAGIFYIRRDLIDFLRPVSVGWNSVVGWNNFGKIDFTLKPHAGRWESGTHNVAGIHALGASVQLLLGLGIEAVKQRVWELTEQLCEQARRAGLVVHSSRQGEDWSGIVSLIVPGCDPRALVRRCRDQGIVINQRAGRLRVSPHCYNSTAEIDRLVEVLCEDR